MLLEGTKLYFLLILLIIFLVYITAKICLGILFNKMGISKWNAFIPLYNKYILVEHLNLPKSLFFKTLIPVVNLFYFNKIIKVLLESFGQYPSESIWYLIFPMYKFPELIFRKPNYSPIEQVYEQQEQQPEIEQNFETINEEPVDINNLPTTSEGIVIAPSNFEQQGLYNNKNDDNINISSQVPNINVKENQTNCPNCGAKIIEGAPVCYSCGHTIS